jgi:molybdopterin molybdotransferase
MLHPNDAESKILSVVHPFQAKHDVELLELVDAQGRVLAEDVRSQLDFPHWDNSAMDGYAVRFEDVKAATHDHPMTLTVIEDIPAGAQPQQRIQPGQAARIFTGAIVPEGADTIVIQENAERAGDQVTVREAPTAGSFVREKAAFYQAGTSLLPSGTVLNAPEIAVLAAAQCSQVRVYRRPVVAILSTGDELVAIDQPLQAGQIVDSNRYALSVLIQSMGAIPQSFGIVPDQPEALKRAIATALENADVVLSSGGVSVGDYDYVDQILEELGATIHVRSVAVKPGKPLTVASVPHKLYFGLPGNPVSALVSFWRFVQPALLKLSGHPAPYSPTVVKGRSRHDLHAGGTRETYLWGRVQLIDGEYEFSLAGGSHSSGNLINLASTNALAIVPIGQTQIPANTSVSIMLVGPSR